jgi:NAD(P)-dependent dehydrogenase (short-subunit alcohol dehydrogenase family)
MKKVLIIGGSGTIGKAIVQTCADRVEVVTASLHNGAFQVDLGDHASIQALFENTGPLDAVVCAASRGVVFKTISEMSLVDYLASMQQKLLGQIQIALSSLPILKDNGSITLTTGIFNQDFVFGGSAAAMVNSGVEGFVQAAACDMPRGIRINAVSPALLEASAEAYREVCPGFEPVASDKVGRAYLRSILGIQTGQVFCVQ